AIPPLAAAHVRILAGTDAGNPGTAPGISMHGELEYLVKAGLIAKQALAAATSVPASTFHLTDRGRIASGLRADLVLVNDDPTAEITATRDIVEVWKEGTSVDRQSWRQSIR
ncbi:MAG TPA: amidohydrolase family protein, partial [Nitrospirota bacterium]